MARPDKAAAVAELTERFSNSAGAVLTDYRGLTVKALKQLRRSLGDDATYAVSKNTLTTIAARQAGVEGIEQHLVGPTAIAFIDGDPVVVAKGLRDFARTNPLLVIKGGVLDGKFLNSDEVRKLADLESREVLLAKVAGGMKGLLQQAVSLFAAPLAQAARAVAALEKAAEVDPSLIGGAGTPAAASAEPAGQDVSSNEPSTNEPVTDQASTDEPSPDEPSTDEPSNDEPSTDEPSSEAPVTDQAGVPEPATLVAAPEEISEPTNDEPAAAAEQTTTDAANAAEDK